ncbi:MAG: hypothetical protein RSG92_27820, partial [Pseudomonas sp.]
MAKRIIACDLDGTLAEYNGWKGIHHVGLPIIPIMNAVKQAIEEGAEVHIFTARVSGEPDEAKDAAEVIMKWCANHGIRISGITAMKHKYFTEFWDDRAIQVIKNTGEMVFAPSEYEKCSSDDHGLSMAGLNEAIERGYNHNERIANVLESLKTPFTPVEIESALDVQEGGDHYKKWKIQPIEFAYANNMPFLDANAFKYICRHR